MRQEGRCLCTQGNPDLFTPAALGFLCRLPALLLLGFLFSIPLADQVMAVRARSVGNVVESWY